MKAQLSSKLSQLGFDLKQIGFGRHVLSLMIVDGPGDSFRLLGIQARSF